MPNILIFKCRNRIAEWFAPAKQSFAPAKRWFAATIRSFAAAKRKRDQAGERENATLIGHDCDLLTGRAEFEVTETGGRESKGRIKMQRKVVALTTSRRYGVYYNDAAGQMSRQRCLLVVVLHVALIMRRQTTHDSVVSLILYCENVFCAARSRINRVVNKELEFMMPHKVEAFCTGEDIERAIDGHRHDGQLQIIGQLKRAFAKDAQMAGESASAFGENDERSTTLQRFSGKVDGCFHLSRTRFIDKDVPCLVAGVAYKGQAAQGLFHHPLKVAVEIPIHEKDIHRPLVVGHKHIALALSQLLATYNFDLQQQESTDEARPQTSRIIAPEMGAAEYAPDTGNQGGEDGRQDEKGQSYHQLITAIDEAKHAFNDVLM